MSSIFCICGGKTKDFTLGKRIHGKKGNYQIKQFLGSGISGIVAKCLKLGSKDMVAVKFFKRNKASMAEREVDTFTKLKKFGLNQNNWVKLIEEFVFEDHVCLVFELLDKNLATLIEGPSMWTHPKPLSLLAIRVIAQQLLVTLNDFKRAQIVHTDIKPENIMLVNHELLPFKVKVIDFACVLWNSETYTGTKIQPCCYRAPEIILGLPFNEAVDMWSLGCLLAFLYLGVDLYPDQSEHEVMRVIVQLQGIPEDHMLCKGFHADCFFTYQSPHGPWRLKAKPDGRQKRISDQFNSLDDLAHKNIKDATVYEDTQTFLSLLKLMLQVDPAKRINPSEALKHSFITMEHFPSDDNEYVKSARLAFEKCQLEQSLVPETENVPPATVGLEDIISAKRTSTLRDTHSLEDKPQKKIAIKVKTWGGASFSLSDTVSMDNGPPSLSSLDNSIADDDDAESIVTIQLDSDVANTNSDERDTGFVKVKTKKKWIERIHIFLSEMANFICCQNDAIE